MNAWHDVLDTRAAAERVCFGMMQVEMLRRVKRYKNGFITEPLTMGPEATVADIRAVP